MKKTLTALFLTLASPALWAFSTAELAQTVQRTGRVYPAAAVEIPEQTDGYGREICPDSEKRPIVANAKTV